MPHAQHLDFDGAWPAGVLSLPQVDLREWGPRLRLVTSPREVNAFYREIGPRLEPLLLSGSGDFHHLTALWLRAMATPVTVICFDNHPDWDRRPPRWACGAWVNRALELPHVERVSVWGCGSFELTFPWRLTGNRAAVNEGRLELFSWSERHSARTNRLFSSVSRDDWRSRFENFAHDLGGKDVYVTVDLDCLAADQASTNWEAGLFRAEDVAWAIGRLTQQARLVAGDVCGAWSAPVYATRFQLVAGWWDHPRISRPAPEEGKRLNLAALTVIWPALETGLRRDARPRKGIEF